MRYTKTFKHYSTILLISLLSSLFLLLGACAELTTPTPVVSNALAATATAPVATFAVAAVPPTATQVPPVPTSTPAPTLTPTALPATAIPVPTATATATLVPPTATRVPPTATKIPPTTRAVPTAGLADAKGDGVGVSILAVNGGSLGKEASVTIQTSPGVECNIKYVVSSGQTSAAKGLEKQISDLNGRITWKWLISQNTTPGKGNITVKCGDSSETKPITIG